MKGPALHVMRGSGATPSPKSAARRTAGRSRPEIEARGQVLVIMALFLVALLGLSALAVDLGYAYVQQRHMQNLADSAATAGMIALNAGTCPASCTTDAQVKQAMANNLAAAHVPVQWDTAVTTTTTALDTVHVRAEYAYYDAAADQTWPSGVLVGSGVVPTMTVSGTAVAPNAIAVDHMAIDTPAFFASVLGRQRFTVQARGTEARRPPASPSGNATAACQVSVPIPSPLGGGSGYYYTFTPAALGDITATWTITPTKSGYAVDLGLYRGTPLGAGSGTSSRQPNTDTTLQGAQMDMRTQVSAAAPITQSLDYSADTGNGLIAGDGSTPYTIYFYQGTNQSATVGGATAVTLTYMCRVPPPPATSAPFVPFALWGGNPSGLTYGATYNFWGHSWDDQVSAGSTTYGTTARFKGYIDTLPTGFNLANPTALSCPTGATDPTVCWSTSPGNSSHPPGPGSPILDAHGCLPATIDVPVIGSATKVGGTDYGSIVAIVQLAVQNPCSYRPDPGHPMFGTITGVVWSSSSGLVQGAPTTISQAPPPQP